jgi:hypothetical protein
LWSGSPRGWELLRGKRFEGNSEVHDPLLYPGCVKGAQGRYRVLILALRALRDAASTDDPYLKKRAVEAFVVAAYELARYVEDS